MLAENSKMAVKPVVTTDIVKQQKELEEQRRKIKEQQEELKRRQEALLKQNSSSIPPILGNLLHFGVRSNSFTRVPKLVLLLDFYSLFHCICIKLNAICAQDF